MTRRRVGTCTAGGAPIRLGANAPAGAKRLAEALDRAKAAA